MTIRALQSVEAHDLVIEWQLILVRARHGSAVDRRQIALVHRVFIDDDANLVYVAHGERMTDVSPEDRRLYASVDAGFIGQNVYLYCASEGLATVFRAAVDYAGLAKTMNLPSQQFVTFAQTVGYPAS